MHRLAVLSLGGNRLSSIEKLRLRRWRCLRTLFLHDNFISAIADGLCGLTQLAELILDGNFIRRLYGDSFVDQNASLRELHLEHNLLESFSFVEDLRQLRSLHVSQNRISQVTHIEALRPLTRLLELSLSRNQLCRKRIYRELVVGRCPSLCIIDMRAVTQKERHLAATLVNFEASRAAVLVSVYPQSLL